MLVNTESPREDLNTVLIKQGTRFGKPFSGVFYTTESTLKLSKKNNSKYCLILLNDKVLWILIKNDEDVEFTVSEINKEKLANSNIPTIVPEVIETEEETMNRIKQRFNILHRLVNGVCAGAIKALVVSGPAGVGKSHGIEEELRKHSAVEKYKYDFIKGTASPIYIYQKLHEYQDEKSILVFDDCCNIFFDPVSLNLLKAALDSSKVRTITWGTESRILKEKDIPNSFQFKGAVVFITNLKFDKIRSDSLKEHLKAIESRCHYLDLTIDSARDKLFRIKQIIRDSTILTDYGFAEDRVQDIVEYITGNSDKFRELSLRTVKKVADIALYTDAWKEIVEVTCYKTR